jgi:hypothetical protein
LQQIAAVAAVAANCSGLHFNLSLRFLRYLGVKYLHPLAATCSQLQQIAAVAAACTGVRSNAKSQPKSNPLIYTGVIGIPQLM